MNPRNESHPLHVSGEPNIDDVHADASPSNTDPFKFSHGLTGVDQPANYLFVNILIATIMVPVIIALAHRLIVYVRNDRRRISVITSCRGQNFWRTDRYSTLGTIKKTFLYASLLGHRLKWALRLKAVIRLPTRPQAMVLTIYIISNIAYCLAIPEKGPAQRFADLRGRCGALAAFNLIFTILFALRNNPFIWILGISYDTFNLFHRWAARLVILQSMAHIAAFIYNTYHVEYKGQGGFNNIRWVLGHSTSYRWGLAGFTAFMFLSLQSLGPLRRAFYDTFLTLHRLGIIVAMSGVYFHLAKHALPQLPWAYLSISLLAFESAVRIARIIYYNFSWTQGSRTRITAEALPEAATRITISIPRSMNCRPGSHTYLYLPRLAPSSSHPFSVAWCTWSGEATKYNKELPADIDDLAIKYSPSTISCIIRARTGMTRSLYDRASGAESKYIELWGLIEGTYYGYHSLSSYGTIVLFAAGVGITHQLSFVRHLLKGFNHNTSATRKILLVWCIPSVECVEWIRPWLEELANTQSFSDIVRLRLYISRPTPHTGAILPWHFQAEVHSQRCSPQEIIDEQILAQIGAMAVTVCGPGGFNDSVRAAVRRRVGLRSIDFFEEAFSS
ncbi:ferric reductase like transmembrane component [Stagonosporopsis vannaccii]|nr:ferric reductase like transmembrane component [Stagonosporopsis vannaccii]